MGLFRQYGQRVSAGEHRATHLTLGTKLPRSLNLLRSVMVASFATTFLVLTPTLEAQRSKNKKKDQLLDAMSVAGDDGAVCSIYGSGKKYYAIITRVDGSKVAGKPAWTLKAAKQALGDLAQSMKSLASAADKKKLKKAKKDKAQLSKAKAQLIQCEKNRKSDSGAHPIRFPQVKQILEKRCINCHGVLGWTNEESFYVGSGRVVPSSLEESPLYTFLSNNPEGYAPAYMPKGLAPLPEMETLLLSRWILNLKEDGGEDGGTPDSPEAEGRALYKTFCSSCHGPLYSSAKWGKTEADIKVALGNIPQMRHMRLTNDQIRNIALALSRVSPPVEGTLAVRSIANTSEGNNGERKTVQFEVVLSGNTSRPFTVGYVTSNGSALAESDFVFAANTLTFEGRDGERKVVSVEVIGDTFEEADETVYLDIGGLNFGGVRISTSTAFASILNDDTLVQVLPPNAGRLRAAYGFNGSYADAMQFGDASVQGDVVITPNAKVGSGALELDAGSDHLLLPGANLQRLPSFTFAAWVNWQNNSNTTRLFDFGSSGTNYLFFSPRDTANRCRFELRSGNTIIAVQCNTNVTLPADTWVHVATTFNTDTDEMKIFFNGQQVATRSGVTVDFTTMVFNDNKLGESRLAGNVDFTGRIDEVGIWDSALTPAMLAELIAMQESIVINSGVEVRFDGQLLANGATLNFGEVEIGSHETHALTINNFGTAGVALTGAPLVATHGKNATEFSIQHQPWPWQTLIGSGNFTSFSLRFVPRTPGPKSATISISNSDLKNGNYAFAASGYATGEPLADGPAGDSDNPHVVQGRELYTVNCSSCHGPISNSQKTGATLERIATAMNPTTGIPQMRNLGLTQQQIELIVQALNAPAPQAKEVEYASNSGVVIGTGALVASVFKDIFLPADPASYTNDDNTIRTRINENILGLRNNNTFITGRAAFMGGRCDHFDTLCNAEAYSAPQQPAPNPIRTGYIVRTCDELLSIERGLDNALFKIGREGTSAIDAAAMRAMYELFFPGREIPRYLSEIISNFPRNVPNFSARDNWRFALNLICVSDGWEGL